MYFIVLFSIYFTSVLCNLNCENSKLFGALFALLSIILGALNSHTSKLLPETAFESIDLSLDI